jgi:hypothetical protein
VVVIGIVLAVRKAGARTISSLVFLGVSGLGYALVISNLGTSYRQRDQLLLVMLAFAGVAFDAILRWLRPQHAPGPTGSASEIHDT